MIDDLQEFERRAIGALRGDYPGEEALDFCCNEATFKQIIAYRRDKTQMFLQKVLKPLHQGEKQEWFKRIKQKY